MRREVVRGLMGPVAFGTASVVGARMQRGYRPLDQPVSSLAAHGSDAAPVMIPGFLGLAASTAALSRQVRNTPAGPPPVPALLNVIAVLIAAAGLARCSDPTCPMRSFGDQVKPTDDVHAAASAPAFLLWIAIPFVAAVKAQDASPSFRRRSRGLGISTLLAAIVMGATAKPPPARWGGLTQRMMLASALAWYPVAAAESGRTRK